MNWFGDGLHVSEAGLTSAILPISEVFNDCHLTSSTNTEEDLCRGVGRTKKRSAVPIVAQNAS